MASLQPNPITADIPGPQSLELVANEPHAAGMQPPAGTKAGNLEARSCPPGPESRSLDRALVRAMAWTGAAKWTVQLLTWVSTIVVARILSPSDYGLYGMATIYMGFVALISEFGLGQAVITMREISRRHVAQINCLSLGSGILLFLISCALAKPIGHFFHTAKLPAVIVVMSISFIVSSAQVVPDAMLQRSLRFKLIAALDTIRAITQAGLTLTLAWLHFGYWSLALGCVAGAVVYAALAVLSSPHAMAWPRLAEIRQALRFSADVLGSRIAWYTYSNSDFVVAGRLLGQMALGAYTIAWTVASTPVEKVTNMITRVTPAFFSEIQHDKAQLRRYLLQISEGLALLTFPASMGMAMVADQFVLVILGPKWTPAIMPLRLLAIYAAMRSITTVFPSILYALRHSRFVLWNSIAAAIVFPVAFYFTSRWGTSGIGITWIVLYPLMTAPYVWKTLSVLDLPQWQYLRSLSTALLSSLAMVLCVGAVRFALPSGLPVAVRLACSVAAGAIVYGGIMLLTQRSRAVAIWHLMRGRSLARVPSVAD